MEIQRLGLVEYKDAWELQMELLGARAESKISDTLLVVEHPPVFTLGRKTPGVREENDLPQALGGIPVFAVERGGEATYHGPGQAVLYPIFQLDLLRTGPRKFLRMMEDAIVAVLANYGVESHWVEGKTGVWLADKNGRERKIASLGIAVRRSVSYHGLALNVNNDLEPFRLIQPCGFQPEVMTSMSEILERKLDLREVQDRLVQEVAARFQSLKANA